MRRIEREIGNRACYFENKAYFKKKGLNKRCVLHEFYHHLVDAKGWDRNSIPKPKVKFKLSMQSNRILSVLMKGR